MSIGQRLRELEAKDSNRPIQLELNLRYPVEKNYRVPTRTEDPRSTGSMADGWIRDFCEFNGLKLPRGYHTKTKGQKIGMLNGMMRYYGISMDDILDPVRKNP